MTDSKNYIIMFSSPSDVIKEKKIFYEVVHKWDSIYSEELKIGLKPTDWDNVYPNISNKGESQKEINKQILDKTDILIVVFRARIGSPTLKYLSGTVEEVIKSIEAGKTVLLYLYDGTLPQSVLKQPENYEQYKKLHYFIENNIQYKGIYKKYKTNKDFEKKFTEDLQRLMMDIKKNNSLLDDIIKFSQLSNEELNTIKRKININMDTIFILRKFVLNSWLLEPSHFDIFIPSIPNNIDKWEVPACFEGFISASLCLLYFIEDHIQEIKKGKFPKDEDDFLVPITYIRLLGTYNKNQEMTATNDSNTFESDEKLEFDNLWNIDLSDTPKKFIKILFDLCPPEQSRFFYSTWNLFCNTFFKYIRDTVVNEGALFCLMSDIKYILIDTIDEIQNEYLKKYHNDIFVFWVSMVNLFIMYELRLDGYEKIEDELNFINENEVKNGRKTWQELSRGNLFYNENDEINIRNILNYFDDKEHGLRAAVSYFYLYKKDDDDWS